MLETEFKHTGRVYKVQTFGTLQAKIFYDDVVGSTLEIIYGDEHFRSPESVHFLTGVDNRKCFRKMGERLRDFSSSSLSWPRYTFLLKVQRQ
jgi:hypothetical protein